MLNETSVEQSLDSLGSRLLNALIGLILTVCCGFAAALLKYVQNHNTQMEEFKHANEAKLQLQRRMTEHMTVNPMFNSLSNIGSTPKSGDSDDTDKPSSDSGRHLTKRATSSKKKKNAPDSD